MLLKNMLVLYELMQKNQCRKKEWLSEKPKVNETRTHMENAFKDFKKENQH